jgi:hypothetical protein
LVSSQLHSVFVLIDAFDEVNSEHQQTFLSLIQRISQNSIKIMVTSRPHLEMAQEIDKSGLRLSISATDSDIKEYLSTRLNKKRQLAPGLKDTVVEALSSGADGMYHPSPSVAKR